MSQGRTIDRRSVTMSLNLFRAGVNSGQVADVEDFGIAMSK